MQQNKFRDCTLGLLLFGIGGTGLYFADKDFKQAEFLENRTTVEDNGRRISINRSPIATDPVNQGGVEALYASHEALSNIDSLLVRPARVGLLVLHLRESGEFLISQGNHKDGERILKATEEFVKNVNGESATLLLAPLPDEYENRMQVVSQTWISEAPKFTPKNALIGLKIKVEDPLWAGYIKYAHPQFRLEKP